MIRDSQPFLLFKHDFSVRVIFERSMSGLFEIILCMF